MQTIVKELLPGVWAIQRVQGTDVHEAQETFDTSADAVKEARRRFKDRPIDVQETSPALKKAWSEGYATGDAGKGAIDNPYAPEDSDLHDAWERGRQEGVTDH